MNHINKHHKLHAWVAYAPLLFIAGIFIGLVAHLFFPFPLVPSVAGIVVGLSILMLAPMFIIWAQKTHRHLFAGEHAFTCDHFQKGPYRVSRNPAYLGMFALVFGLAFLINSLPMLMVAIFLGPLFTFIIVPREEKILEAVCGQHFQDYKDKVRMWF